MEEVVPLEATAEAVEGLTGLPDPETHRVKRLRHLSGRWRARAQNGDCGGAEAAVALRLLAPGLGPWGDLEERGELS